MMMTYSMTCLKISCRPWTVQFQIQGIAFRQIPVELFCTSGNPAGFCFMLYTWYSGCPIPGLPFTSENILKTQNQSHNMFPSEWVDRYPKMRQTFVLTVELFHPWVAIKDSLCYFTFVSFDSKWYSKCRTTYGECRKIDEACFAFHCKWHIVTKASLFANYIWVF